MDEFNLDPGVHCSVEATSCKYDFYIYGGISGVENYLGLLETLSTASESDVVYLHINSMGGEMFTAIPIVNAMRECKANVITVAEGAVMSAGSLIFFAGDGLVVNPHCSFMVHDVECGALGKVGGNKAHSDHLHKGTEELYRDVYLPFLSEEEVAGVLAGADMYMSSDDVIGRIEALTEEVEEEEEVELD